MTPPNTNPIPYAPIREWRCVCPVRPLLGLFTDGGGLFIRVAGRREQPAGYVFDLAKQSGTGHCPSCHTWRELVINDKREIVDRQYAGTSPIIGCKCERPGWQPTAAERAGYATNAARFDDRLY